MFYFYFGCLIFGVVYSVLYAFFGSHGIEHHGAELHMDGAHAGDTHDSGPSVLNPVVIASALSAFGGAGLIGDKGLGVPTFITLIFALAISFAIGAAVFYGVVKLLYNSQSDSNFSDEDLYDVEAEVVTPIPKVGLGEIAFTAGGTRTTLPAHSMDDCDIEKGTRVMIRKVENRVAYVRRKIIIDDLIINDEKLKKRGSAN